MWQQTERQAMTDETVETPERDDEGYALDGRTMGAIRLAVAAGDAARLSELLEPLHAADIADLLEQMDSGHRREILPLAPEQGDGEVLSAPRRLYTSDADDAPPLCIHG